MLPPCTFAFRSGFARRARRVLAAGCVALGVASLGCSPSAGPQSAPLEPVALVDTRDLDAEVLELAQRKLEDARRAPQDARAHGSLGLVYSANGLWDAAERSLGHAAQLDPAQGLWRYYRALALREAGHADEAFTLLEQVARDMPTSAAVLQRLGAWRLERGDTQGARDAFTRVLAQSPDQPELLVAVAGVDLAEERWQAACDACQRALRKDPRDKLAHYQLGLALRGLGRNAEAERELSQGVNASSRWINDAFSAELASYKVNYVSQLGDATRLMLANQHAQALPIVERVHKKRPDDVIVLNNLAACLQETGNPARAVELLERATQLAEREFATYLNLADAYMRLSRLDDAQRAADKAVELAPALGRAYLTRARVLALRERFEEAYQSLTQSIKLEPANKSTPLALSEVCARLKRFDEAGAWAQKALQADPNSLQARMQVATLALRRGALEEAAAHVQELARLAPRDERVAALRKELERRMQERGQR